MAPAPQPRKIERLAAVAVLVGASLAGCRRSPPPLAARPAKVVRSVQGNHAVGTDCALGAALLSLKSGLTAEVCARAATGQAALSIADDRLTAAEVAEGFVPLGPSFSLSAPDRAVNISWLAESYQLRAGYRPVLALRADPVRLLDASYSQARFRARVAPEADSLMQFGQVPMADAGVFNARDANSSRSAAP